jgi:hypothetical protein
MAEQFASLPTHQMLLQCLLCNAQKRENYFSLI